MALVKCKTCGGEYETVLADGLQYFHKCPLLTVAELKAAIQAGTIQLRPRDQRALDRAVDEDARAKLEGGPEGFVDHLLGQLAYDRPNHRDENIDRAKAAAAVDERGERRKHLAADALIKQPGLGVDVLVPDDPV